MNRQRNFVRNQGSIDEIPVIMGIWDMKTTIELPEATFRRAKALAAGRGMTLKRFFTEAIEEQIRRCAGARRTEAPWMAGFGALSDLSDENRHVLSLIEEEFETLSPEDLA